MAQIDLTIRKPANGAVFLHSDQIEFKGHADASPELAGVQFHYRWYASLRELAKDAQGTVSQFSINPSAHTDAGTALSTSLPMGSHVVTFAASDQAQESDLKNAHHGGVTGGVNLQGLGHVIHVLKANIVAPTGTTPISVTPGTRFQAEAPSSFEEDSYQLVNGLYFKWKFDPIPGGAATPPGRPRLIVDQEAMHCTFISNPDRPVLELDPETYQHLHGRYRATLQVEAGTPPTMASDSITVEFP